MRNNIVLRLATALAVVFFATATWAAVLPIKSAVVIAIGQKTAIYLVRGDCTGPVPSFASLSAELPKTALGAFSDGGTKSQDSARCKGPVKARVISFTGSKAGKQTLVLGGQKVTVQVK